ncbi:MAG: hypothetical protein ACXQT3_06070 [Methermicoccaceae archaeon]
MGVLDKIRKNPIDKMGIDELRREQMGLKLKLERLKRDIERVEAEKKKLFQKGVGADQLTKKMLATEISGLDTEAKLKARSFITGQKQYQFATNLLVVKRYEKELKKTPVWKKLTRASPEVLQATLDRVSLDGMEYSELLDELNSAFERDVARFEEAQDEGSRELFDMWSKVEAGSMDVEDVEEELSVEKALKDEG